MTSQKLEKLKRDLETARNNVRLVRLSVLARSAHAAAHDPAEGTYIEKRQREYEKLFPQLKRARIDRDRAYVKYRMALDVYIGGR
jgi:hypothetical protein